MVTQNTDPFCSPFLKKKIGRNLELLSFQKMVLKVG